MFNKFFNRFKKSFKAPVLYNRIQQGASYTNWDSKKAIDEGYKSSSWVFACIKRRVDAVSTVKLKVQVKNSDGWEDKEDHILQKLLDNPNPVMNQSEFLRYMVSHLDLDGNFFSMKVKAGQNKTTQELWPVLPYDVSCEVRGKEDSYISYYSFLPTGEKINVDDMLHIQYTDPSNFRRGISPLKAASRAVDIDNASGDFQKISFQQRGIPDGVFQIEGLTSDFEFEHAKKLVKEQYANLGTAREPWVLGNGTWTPLSRTAVEMDFMTTRQFSMKEIAAAYCVPSELISGMGDSNRASSDTVRRSFWEDTILPLVSDIVSHLNLSLANEYKDVRIIADYSNVIPLKRNETELIKNVKELWLMGVPFEALNQKYNLGFESFDGWEKSYITNGVKDEFIQDLSSDNDLIEIGNKDIQKEALNGAQISSLQKIIQDTALGLIPKENAKELVTVAFPTIDKNSIDALFNNIDKFDLDPESKEEDLTLEEKIYKIAYGG